MERFTHQLAVALVLGFVLLAVSLPARAETLSVDLASDHIDITTGFNGSNLILFGVKDQPGDLAVVVRGPDRDMTVRKKNKILGIWINTESVTFNDVPSYYDYALGRRGGYSDTEDAAFLAHGVGINALVLRADSRVPEIQRIRNFQEALVRNKQMQMLFPLNPKEILFLNENFFRITMYLPANVPTGDYTIETLLFREGALVDKKQTILRVAQVGLNAQIYQFALDNSLSYGLLCVFIAAFAGWLINVIRNK